MNPRLLDHHHHHNVNWKRKLVWEKGHSSYILKGGEVATFFSQKKLMFSLTFFTHLDKSTAMAASDRHLFSPNTDFSQLLSGSGIVVHLVRDSKR
jgi:hypothetical protein